MHLNACLYRVVKVIINTLNSVTRTADLDSLKLNVHLDNTEGLQQILGASVIKAAFISDLDKCLRWEADCVAHIASLFGDYIHILRD